MPNSAQSLPFSLSSADLKKLGTGALLALAGATVVWLGQIESQIDLGFWQPFVAAAVAVAINGLRKWIADNTKSAVIVVAALLACSSADAQVAKLTTQTCNGNSCTIGVGTCVNIGSRNGRAYFLTVGHAIGQSNSALIHMDGGAREARVEAVDHSPDLGLVSLPAEEATRVFPLADEVREQSFQFVGFGGAQKWTQRTARRLRRSDGTLVCQMSFNAGGDSGGPYLEGDKVVGIHWGGTGSEGYATDCVTIRRWLYARVGFVPGNASTSQPHPSQPPTSPVACNCSSEIAALKAQVAGLQARCDQPPAPSGPDTSGITKRIDDLEGRIAAAGELAKRIDRLEFSIAEVKLAGGKTDQLEKELDAIRNMTFQVRSLSPDGKVLDAKTTRLGDNIDLRLVPKRQ